MNLAPLISALPTLQRKAGGLFWDDGSGPYPDQVSAYTAHLLDQEAKLAPAPKTVWRVVHDAARQHWKPRTRNERDVLAVLALLMAGVRRKHNTTELLRLACGDQWEAWYADLERGENAPPEAA